VNGVRDQPFAEAGLSADENCGESTADLTACDQAPDLIAHGLNDRALSYQLCPWAPTLPLLLNSLLKDLPL
jgi:hypothetical protein